jgi:hypothetical protein
MLMPGNFDGVCQNLLPFFPNLCPLQAGDRDRIRQNSVVRMTPAQAAGVESSQWTIAELIERWRILNTLRN